ncbi:5683_t:CDS:1 [Funneliformis mosseae]|uniref:5683_t:CDS:1 n=1 Tax=Funneliformis mosseae TaxID=27381 RepID=A0A9N8VCZ5_FUNMO|nr:5683_t:CDS:1 [Funneliformis mosseae]
MLVFGKLPSLNPFYVQRRYDQDLDRLIKEKNTIVLCGASGTGKTQLVRQWVNPILRQTHVNDYEALIWVTADQLDTLLGNCKQIGGSLGIEGCKQLSVDELAESIKRKLEVQRYLVVIDDASSEEVRCIIEKFLPDYNTDIIITSHYEDWDYYKLYINQCTEQEASAIAKHIIKEKKAKIVDETQLRELVLHFESNLLWVTQAANYISENLGGDVVTYLKNGEKSGLLLKDYRKNSQQALSSTLKCFQIFANQSLSKELQEPNLALSVLQICSLLPSRNIPVTLLVQFLHGYSKILEQKSEQLINLLCKKTMLIEREGNYLGMHCSYQTMLNQNILVEENLITTEQLSECQACFLKFLVEKVKWRRSEAINPIKKFQWEGQIDILPHIKSVVTHFEKEAAHQNSLIELYYAMGSYYEAQDFLHEAKGCLIKSRDLCEKSLSTKVLSKLVNMSIVPSIKTTKQEIKERLISEKSDLEQIKMYSIEILYKLASINVRLWNILSESEKNLTIKYLEQSFHMHPLLIKPEDVKAYQDRYYTYRNLAAAYKNQGKSQEAGRIIANLINSDFVKSSAEIRSLAHLDVARGEIKSSPQKAIDNLIESLSSIQSIAEADYSYGNRAKDMTIVYIELGCAYLEISRVEIDETKKFDALKKADTHLRFALKSNRDYYKRENNRTAGRIFYHLAEVNVALRYYFLAHEAVTQALLIQQNFYRDPNHFFVKCSTQLLEGIEDQIKHLKDPPEEIEIKPLQILQEELDQKKERYNMTNEPQLLKEYADVLLATNDPDIRDFAIKIYQEYLKSAPNLDKCRRASVYRRLGYIFCLQKSFKSEGSLMEERKESAKAAYKKAQKHYKDLLAEPEYFGNDVIKYNYNNCFWCLNRLEKSKLADIHLTKNNHELFVRELTNSLLERFIYYKKKLDPNNTTYDKTKIVTGIVKTVAEAFVPTLSVDSSGISASIEPKEIFIGIADLIQAVHTGKMHDKAEQIIQTFESKQDPIKVLFEGIAKKVANIYIEQIQQLEPESIKKFTQFISKQLFAYLGSKKMDFTSDPTETLITGLYFTEYKKNCLLTTSTGVRWNARELLCYTGIITYDKRIYIYTKAPVLNLKYGFRYDKLPVIHRHYEYHQNRLEAEDRLKRLTKSQKTMKCIIM